MKAVILAGGLGSRLKPFTEVIPKPLLPIGEKSVLEIQIERLKHNGFDEIYLATNYMSDYISNFLGDGSRYGVKIIISKEEKPLGTVGPLTLLKEQLTEPFLVMNGDVLTLLNFKQFYDFSIEKNAVLSISIKELITPFRFGNIFFNSDFVTAIEEKPKIKTNILAGVYIFTPEIFKYIPLNEKYDMDKLIEKLLFEKIPITKFDIREYWLDIGQIDDYEQAQEIYKNHFAGNK
jgi:NDP-sugar pyrophosphorylase family protein